MYDISSQATGIGAVIKGSLFLAGIKGLSTQATLVQHIKGAACQEGCIWSQSTYTLKVQVNGV